MEEVERLDDATLECVVEVVRGGGQERAGDHAAGEGDGGVEAPEAVEGTVDEVVRGGGIAQANTLLGDLDGGSELGELVDEPREWRSDHEVVATSGEEPGDVWADVERGVGDEGDAASGHQFDATRWLRAPPCRGIGCTDVPTMPNFHRMKRDHPKLMTLAITAGLVVAACGGDDDTTSAPAAEQPAAEQPAAEQPPAAGAGADGDGSDGDDGDDAGEAGGDDGSASQNDAQQSLDDAGVDLDLEEYADNLSNFSTGEGGGVVTIDGVAYTFGATGVCIFQGTDFVAEGLGQDPDGNPAWVSISLGVDDLDGDGVDGPTVDIFVEPGRTELFGDGPDDAPDFTASYWEGFSDPSEEIVYELSNGLARGSGPVQDYSGIAIPFGERGEMEFEASCT